ncbi:hypothetical protein RSAG8_03354, partial [Rhizoctonia solani AG-8 WAC10335]
MTLMPLYGIIKLKHRLHCVTFLPTKMLCDSLVTAIRTQCLIPSNPMRWEENFQIMAKIAQLRPVEFGSA